MWYFLQRKELNPKLLIKLLNINGKGTVVSPMPKLTIDKIPFRHLKAKRLEIVVDVDFTHRSSICVLTVKCKRVMHLMNG